MRNDFQPGTYKIIRVDGTETLIGETPTLPAVYKAIGCGCIDTVRIDRSRDIVMLVDDTGMITNKPINPKATELYRAICRPGMQNGFIHGDVALVHDIDFE